MASRSSMVCGKSPSCCFRPSMSSVIFSCTFRFPSRNKAISSLIAAICSLKLAPVSKLARLDSILFTCDTFGLFFFSSWISFKYSFSSFNGIVSVHNLNSMSAMRWSMSASLVKPMDFFILLSWLRMSAPSCRLSPMALLISAFLFIKLSIFNENSFNWARRPSLWAKNSSLPPERSAILVARACCFFCKPSMVSWIFAIWASKAARSGACMRSFSSPSSGALGLLLAFAFGFDLAAALASAAALGGILADLKGELLRTGHTLR
mmetsp:Transcript_64834/g.187953  ORF Transcript_64834/g.187953 Transcript_64834/m.187953 type:complete len:264 (-) Transcript_64834:23-814(-)